MSLITGGVVYIGSVMVEGLRERDGRPDIHRMMIQG